jgi:predicted enzyme related to lactoylglutathione lyase
MSDRKPLPGKFVWFELIARDAKKAQAFYGAVLGWKVQAVPMGDQSYEMISAGDTMIGGYAAPKSARQPSHWISYVSVEDVDAAAKDAAAHGGKLIEAPYDIPGVGRAARIADPEGAEICPFRNSAGDAPDELATQGRFFWDELHTPNPVKALAFYERVVGFAHRAMEGPGDTYYVLESHGGVGRGGLTSHLAPDAPPHWLPYVFVDDPDATLARAKKLGAVIQIGPADIPGVGRFGVFHDPVGAVLAVMKPLPIGRPVIGS